MHRPRGVCRRLFIVLMCYGISTALPALGMAAWPAAAPSETALAAVEGPASSAQGAQEPSDEQVALKAKLEEATQALESLKKEVAPHLAEAESTVQYVSTALEKAIQPEEITRYEEELRLAEEWQTLLHDEITLAEEAVQATEGLLQMLQRRAVLAGDRARFQEELKSASFSPQDAKLATAEALVAGERASLASNKAETLQGEVIAFEKEAADLRIEAARVSQEIPSGDRESNVPAEPTAHIGKAAELALATRRARIALKKGDIAQKQFAVIQEKYALAKQEKDLFAAHAEFLEERAEAIRQTVGLSVEDLKAEQEQTAAAQHAAEMQKQKALQEQVKAQEERLKAQQALQQARLATQQATTEPQQRLAGLRQHMAEQEAVLAQKKADLAKEKVAVAGVAAEIAQKRLGLTTRKLEIERKALTASDMLSHYEMAKAEAARATTSVRMARANAELARRELEAFKREAELAQLKLQAEKSQPEFLAGDQLARETADALEDGARIALQRSQIAEEWADILQERARLASERQQIVSELEQLLGQRRATYQLWKREPSKITWAALEEVYTDLVLFRSALIVGIATWPTEIGTLLADVRHPSGYLSGLQLALGAVLCFSLATIGAVLLRRRLQPMISAQEQWFLPGGRKKLLRAAIRLLHNVMLPTSLFFAGVLIWRLATGARSLVTPVLVGLAGIACYRFLNGVIQELFMPWNPPQRLINCRDGIASYLYRHLHRMTLYLCVFLTLTYLLQVVGYHEGFIALLRLINDLGLLVLFTLLVHNKEAIISLLPRGQNRFEKTIYVGVTQVYPLLVFLLICIVALSNLGYANLAHFLARSCALTAVILTGAYFAAIGIDKLLHWGFVSRQRVEAEVILSDETRQTLYLIFKHGLSCLIYVAAVIVIAGTWGVDLSGVYTTLTSETARDYYQRLGAAVFIIVVSTLFLRSTYYLIDRVFNLSTEEVRSWRKKIALGDKGRTVAPLLKSLLKYGTIFVAAVLVLRALGVDPTPIIAGAGVIGLAVGFGAQTLVKDVIAGFFLLFEGVIAVGDVITFGNSSGVVEEVGLRVTKYRTFSGELWVIPNGEIRAFGNYNRQWMRAVVPVGVAYEQEVGKAMRVLEEVGKAWAAERRDIALEAPVVQGIISFDDSAVTLRLVVKVRPLQHAVAEWELRRRIKEAFDREGIEIPFPRRVFISRQEGNGVNQEGNSVNAVEDNIALLPTRAQKVEDSPTLGAEKAG